MARTAGSHSDITGPKLRAAALGLFAAHGFAAVSMRQIAARVGVQAGALYNYIPDKQTLLFDLLHGHMEDLLSAFRDDPSQPPVLRLEHFVRFHIQYHYDRPDAVFISYMELRNLTPDNFARIESLRRAYEKQLETILNAGLASGDFHLKDPKVASFAVIAMLTGVNTWFKEGGRLSISDVQTRYWDMVRNCVGAQG